jgi:hypothetical protein
MVTVNRIYMVGPLGLLGALMGLGVAIGGVIALLNAIGGPILVGIALGIYGGAVGTPKPADFVPMIQPLPEYIMGGPEAPSFWRIKAPVTPLFLLQLPVFATILTAGIILAVLVAGAALLLLGFAIIGLIYALPALIVIGIVWALYRWIVK